MLPNFFFVLFLVCYYCSCNSAFIYQVCLVRRENDFQVKLPIVCHLRWWLHTVTFNAEVEKLWIDTGTSSKFMSALSALIVNKTFRKIEEKLKTCPGIRVLKQDPTETLFSFLCSVNNSISRIVPMIEKMATAYGSQVSQAEWLRLLILCSRTTHSTDVLR